MWEHASLCREVLLERCIKKKDKISGEGKIVELDDSRFGKANRNVGQIEGDQWVIGGICRETRSCFMVPIEKRDSETLLCAIQENIEPGTIIIS